MIFLLNQIVSMKSQIDEFNHNIKPQINMKLNRYKLMIFNQLMINIQFQNAIQLELMNKFKSELIKLNKCMKTIFLV